MRTARRLTHRSPRPLAAAVVAAAVALAACGSTAPVTAPPVDPPTVLPAGALIVHPTATPNPGSNCTASYAPVGALPAPGHMPAGSWMAHIQARGYLIAGVDQSTYL